MDFGESGHICAFGPTECGKSFYIKDIIKKEIKKGNVGKKNIYVFTKSTDDSWDIDMSDQKIKPMVYDDWDDIDTVRENVKMNNDNKERSIIVIDDFNESITKGDKKREELFTRSRHDGCRVITVAHEPKSVGPTIRNNIRYGVVFNQKQQDVMKKLAEMFTMGEIDPVKNWMKGFDKEHQCFVYDTRTSKGVYDMASTENVNTTANTTIVNNNQKQVGNDDNSTTFNINKVENTQRMDYNKTSNQITMNNYQFNMKMKKMTMKDQAYDLICRNYLNIDEKNELIRIIRSLANTNKVNGSNLETYKKGFMKKYYDTDYIKPSNKQQAKSVAGNMLFNKYSMGQNLYQLASDYL